MNPKKLIPMLLIIAVVLFAQCKSCDCSYQPRKAVIKRTWIKR